MSLRVLFDKNVPVTLRHSLTGHAVRTVTEEGWETLENGKLLAHAEASGFDVLLTCDQNLQYQQNLSGFKIAVVLIRAASNRLSDILPLLPELVAAVRSAVPGKIQVVPLN